MSREINKKKINDFINVYCQLLGLDKVKNKTLIIYFKEAIYERALKYENIKVPTSIDNFENYIIKPTNNEWNIEDFLLNRLFVSLREIDANDYDMNGSGSFADYIASDGELTYSLKGIYNKYKQHYQNDQQASKLTFKTFSHEIGHALKSQYSGGYKYKSHRKDDKKNNLYIELKERLKEINNGEYKDEINENIRIDNNEELKLEKTGVRGKKNGYISSKQMYLIGDRIDEMMNEDEAVELCGNLPCQKYTHIYNKDGTTLSGFYVNVPNKLSGYCKFYGIGTQFKNLLGKKRYFELQYGNSDEILELFDTNFQDISNQMFGENKFTPTQVIYLNNLTIWNQGRTYESFLESNEFLARCYEKIVKEHLSGNKYTNKTLEKITEEIDQMINYTTHNQNPDIDNKLAHIVIYKKLRKQVLEKQKELIINSMVNDKVNEENYKKVVI